MAKILLGPMVGQASGSVGGVVFSRNRYGTYLRRRAHPTTSQSSWALDAKSILGAVSREWGGLDEAERVAWATWAANNPVTDKLGSKQVLAGNAAYMMINGRINAGGLSSISVPPVAYAPPALDSVTLDADIGSGDFDLTFAGTPLAAGHRLWIQAAVTGGNSQSYVKNKLRLIGISASAATSPLTVVQLPSLVEDTLPIRLVARFGTLAVGQLITMYVSVVDLTTGLLSTPMVTEALVTDTP